MAGPGSLPSNQEESDSKPTRIGRENSATTEPKDGDFLHLMHHVNLRDDGCDKFSNSRI